MTETYRDWHEKLPFALLAYRTSVRTSTGATPFSLVYGMEAILPIEVEIPSLRILTEIRLDEAEWVQSRYDQLNLIQEKRLKAIRHGQMYQKSMIRAYDKKVRPREFCEGDLVLKKILPIQKDFRGKWMPNWEGPYVVKKAFSGGALILTEMDGKSLPNLGFNAYQRPDHRSSFGLAPNYVMNVMTITKAPSAVIDYAASTPNMVTARSLARLPARKGNKQQIREKAEQKMARKSQHISQRSKKSEISFLM
ncbi:uncharacterized protein LOC128284216 [Gossypium arboreum]|uniref:uncharacterized protein LOC128284216 n=1 Tax=Gossypium arboreum TaxID=29729 RepID=UPI0022F18D13|nr:uncharacterized protein LOC128284216 [Gossypium arboreum]